MHRKYSFAGTILIAESMTMKDYAFLIDRQAGAAFADDIQMKLLNNRVKKFLGKDKSAGPLIAALDSQGLTGPCHTLLDPHIGGWHRSVVIVPPGHSPRHPRRGAR
jgi:hypothetical protein